MNRVKLETNTGRIIVCTGAASYYEMSVRDYIEFASKWDRANDFLAFSLLYGIDYDLLLTYRADPADIQAAIKFVYTQDLDKLEVPQVFEFKGKRHTIPQDVKTAALGQHFWLRAKARAAGKPEELIPIAVAAFLQPVIDNGKFDANRAETLSLELAAMPITTIYPIANFFLARRQNFGSYMIDVLCRPMTLLMKLLKTFQRLQVLNNSVKHTVILISLMLMLPSLDSTQTMFSYYLLPV